MVTVHYPESGQCGGLEVTVINLKHSHVKRTQIPWTVLIEADAAGQDCIGTIRFSQPGIESNPISELYCEKPDNFSNNGLAKWITNEHNFNLNVKSNANSEMTIDITYPF